jgi:hypothetical protein
VLSGSAENLAGELRLINPQTSRSKQASGRFQKPRSKPQR